MRAFAMSEFKAKCLAIVDDVARTSDPVILTKRGRVIARVVPATEDHPQRLLSATVQTLGDVVSPVLPAGAWEAETGHAKRRQPAGGARGARRAKRKKSS